MVMAVLHLWDQFERLEAAAFIGNPQLATDFFKPQSLKASKK
jgi:hypothetical protein